MSLELSLKNLSEKQVIAILSELAPIKEQAKIMEEVCRNRLMADSEIISKLMKVVGHHLNH
jgi:hypothetical protein